MRLITVSLILISMLAHTTGVLAGVAGALGDKIECCSGDDEEEVTERGPSIENSCNDCCHGCSKDASCCRVSLPSLLLLLPPQSCAFTLITLPAISLASDPSAQPIDSMYRSGVDRPPKVNLPI